MSKFDDFADLEMELQSYLTESEKSQLASELEGDLNKMFMEESESKKAISEPVRKSRKSKREMESRYNETMTFLYGNKAKNWETWSASLISYSLKKGLVSRMGCASTQESDARDLVYSFLTWVCAEDKLKGRTQEKVMFHWVQSTMFVQWVQRSREKEGQDAHARTRFKKNRTQQERKVGTFTFTSPDSASVVIERDEDGQEVSQDLYVPSQVSTLETDLLMENIREVVSQTLLETAPTDEEGEMWCKVWDVLSVQKDPTQKMYETDQAWADDWKMELPILRRVKEKVKKVVADSGILG
jgi:hypothetical protein